MSTIKHPVGAQSSKVYWRRRLLVGLGLVIVIVVVVLIIIKPGAGNADPKKPAIPVASASAPTDVTSTTIPTDAATVAGAPCKPANVTVQALTDDTTYAAGELPKISLALTNTGPKSCTIDAGTAMQVYAITSGGEVYWKSTDCQVDPVHTEILLTPSKKVTSVPISWDRTRSDPKTCKGGRDTVPAGGASYHLTTSVDGIASETTKQFLLH